MISILLTSYNGEKYISEQIESLLNQTMQDFRLFISDDRSTDNTFEIALEYAGKYPGKINIVQNKENSGGAKYNFIKMMIEHKDDYVMLCDQDDVWLPNKIEATLTKMKTMENEFGARTPLLVHTDLCVVNEKLETISPSFKAAMNADYGKTRLHNQIIQNTLTGCTAMYNRALADLIIIGIPPFIVMHDWWLMLIASAFGKISSLDMQTVLYRQHNMNEIGAKDVRTFRYKLRKIINNKEIKEAIAGTYLQAESFLNVYKRQLSQEQIDLLEEYCKIPLKNKLKKWQTVLRLGTLKNGFARNVAYFLFI